MWQSALAGSCISRTEVSARPGIIEKLTDAMVSVEGEAMRPVTWVTLEEVTSGDWGMADKALHTIDVVGMRSTPSNQNPTSVAGGDRDSH